MRPVPLLLMAVGVLILLAGIVFTLQGSGYVGPQSSFMFNNPAWIYQGITATAIGLIIIAGGFLLGRRARGAAR